jgi:hypothetical protein
MMDDHAFFLVMSLIILLIDMIQEAFVEAHPMNSTSFECSDSECTTNARIHICVVIYYFT